MIGKEKLDRINELARKQREESLTKEELCEQSELRGEYIRAFRNQFEGHLQAMGMNRVPKETHNCSCGCGHRH